MDDVKPEPREEAVGVGDPHERRDLRDARRRVALNLVGVEEREGPREPARARAFLVRLGLGFALGFQRLPQDAHRGPLALAHGMAQLQSPAENGPDGSLVSVDEPFRPDGEAFEAPVAIADERAP